MKFEVVDNMRYIVASENIITSDTFNGYSIDDIEKYRKYLRKEFSKFLDEMDNNFKSPNVLSEEGYISLFYRANCWEAYLGYVEGQKKTLTSEHEISDENRLKFKEFFELKELYVKRIASFLQRGIDSINDGVKHYQELGKRSDLEKAKKLLEKHKGKQFYFACKLTSKERDKIFDFLIKNKFISENTPLMDFRYAFVAIGEASPIAQYPYLIRWIDKTKNPHHYNRRSLLYFINQLIEFHIITIGGEKINSSKETNEFRNNVIKYFFSDPNGNAIEDISDVGKEDKPQRFKEIKSFIQELKILYNH